MKKILLLITVFFCSGSLPAVAADWVGLADRAVSLSAGDVRVLESKSDKTLGDLYQLTIYYYRQYDHDGLAALFSETKDQYPADSEARVLEAIILMREHRHAQSRAVLDRVLARKPD